MIYHITCKTFQNTLKKLQSQIMDTLLFVFQNTIEHPYISGIFINNIFQVNMKVNEKSQYIDADKPLSPSSYSGPQIFRTCSRVSAWIQYYLFFKIF